MKDIRVTVSPAAAVNRKMYLLPNKVRYTQMYIEQTSEAGFKKVKSTLFKKKKRKNKREKFEEVEKQTHSRAREEKKNLM